MRASPQDYFRRQGLKPLNWDEVLKVVESRLASPNLPVFQRLHRSFVGYPVEHTCRAFYDFCVSHGLSDLLASFRFERLCRIGACLSGLVLRERNILDIGAGGGYLAGYLKEELGANVSVADWSAESRKHLQTAGFETFATELDPGLSGKQFDFILAADSLGEVNADEDSWLREPENATDPGYPDELDQRYGFTDKLAAWKSFLRPGGSVLLFEPIGLPMFWQGAALSLRQSGWKADIIGPEPVWGLLLY